MSPRITAFVRFVIVTGLVCLLAPALSAQTCAPPTLVTEPDVCLGANGHAYVSEGTFSSYQWSIVNGTVTYGGGTPNITFLPSGAGDVELTVVTTDGSGCPSQSTATVPIGTPAPPVIQISQESLCAGTYGPQGYASVAPPPTGTTYIAYQWSITNGTVGENGQPFVTFSVDGTGPAELTLHATDNRGCQTSASVAVPMRTLPVPVIELYEPSICPGSNAMGGYATVAAPPEGTTYASFTWSIVNGTLPYGYGGSSVSFLADGNGPVELSVIAYDDRGCEATSSVTVPIRTIAPPEIELYETSVCPGPNAMGGYASIAPPPAGTNYSSFQWSIAGGTLPYGDATSSVSFLSDGTAPVELSVTVRDDRGCEATSSVTVPIRTIPPPQIEVYEPSVCPGPNAMGGYVNVAPPPAGITYTSFQWSIINGTLPYGDATSGVSFKSDGNAPVELTVTVRDSRGCESSASVTVPIRTIPPPQIEVYEPSVCPGPNAMGGYVNVAPPPVGVSYTSYQWTIVNGTLPYGTTGSGVSFKSDGNAPVVLTVTVRDSRGCEATSSVTVPIRTIPSPEIELEEANVCPGPGPGAYANAGPPPPGITYMGNEWTIAHGTITYDNHAPSVTFEADGTGPVELTLTVRDSRGCTASKTVTVPLGAEPPQIVLDQPTYCSTEPNHASISSMWQSNITWTVTNGTVLSGQGTRHVDFAGTGAGPITLSVTATNYRDCPGTGSVVIPSSATPVPIYAPDTACVGSLQKVAGETVNGQSNFHWTIANATVEGPTDQRELYFRANGNGPVEVSVTATTWQGCATANSISIPLGPMPTPEIQTNIDRLCPGAWINAYFYAPDDVFGQVDWTVTNATNIQPFGSGVSFQHIAGAGDVTITANVGEGNCTATASKVMQVVQAPSPVLTIDTPTMCEGSTNQLTFENYSSFTQVYISVTNGFVMSELAGPGAAGHRYNIRATAPGTMTINIWGDANGCVLQGTKTVNVLAAPVSITTSGPTTFCQGGSVTLTANTGSSYSWSNGATTRAITVTQSGNYTVTVHQANGCSNSTSRSVTVNPLPGNTITASGPTTFCAGGSVTLTAPAGSSYTWSNGATTPSITVSNAGTYSVTVRSSANCLRTSNPVTVIVNPKPAAGITESQVAGGSGTITRTGDTIQACGNPTVRLTPVALDAQSTYAWSNGANTATLDVTSSGTYTVTVTTPQGCSTSSSVTVNYGAIPQKPVIAASATELCPAGGTVTLTAPAADGWTWSNGATTQSVTVAAAGAYTVRTRAGACDSPLSDPVVITNGVSTINSENLFLCEPGSSVILGAAGGTSWLWSNGATTPSITVTEPGTYSVTTTNDGCTMEESAPVTVTRRSVTIGASGPLSFCSGDSVTLTASGGHMWQWSNGATTQSITVSQSGTYSVLARFPEGCLIPSAPVAVEARSVTSTISASGPTTLCEGGNVTLTASAGASYLWSNGATTRSIAVSAGGNYSVIVTDAAGCSATSTATAITVNANPISTITPSGPTTFCEGGNVTLTASSGASYSWSNGATTPSITVNAAGDYSVTVTNAAGCSTTSAATAVAVNANPVATITPSGPTTFCEGGNVTLTASSGTSYLWSNGAATSSITVSESGSYSVTVTNANGCSTTSAATAVTVNANPIATITPSGPTTFCEGGNVTLTASSGASYLWSNGATTPSITVNASGSYSVTVSNANGCSTTSAATAVTVNANPIATISASGPTTFCEGGNVTLTASAGSSYSWSNGATTQSITVADAGSYSVTVTNATGCSATSAATAVTVNANPSATITPSGPTTFCEGGSVTLTASSGASYSWSNGATTQSITVNAAGDYSVTVTNAAGCSTTSAATAVTVNANPIATISASGPTTFCEGGNVTLTASSGASYLWSNGATTSSITVSASGNYSVTITNAAGCNTTSAATAVTVNANPIATITPSGATTFCEGGSVTLTASSGASYSWSNGATTQSITVHSAGSYSVTVSNANGCSATSAATAVTVNANPIATITPSGPTTFCEGGNVTLTASSGASYLWSNGATQPSITVNAAGNYSVTVTNAAGCSTTSAATTITVHANPIATITPSGPTTFCTGGNVTLTASSGTSYLWSNGATTPSITVSASGNYTVRVTNANGCSTTSAATAVTVHALPSATTSASGPTTFCAGGNVTLTASAGSSWLWSNGATTQSIDVTASGSYSVTVTNTNGCSATSAPRVVTVNPLPTPSISASGPTTFCVPGSVTLTGQGGSGTWYRDGAFYSNAPAITINTTGSWSFTYRITSGAGCTAEAQPVVVTGNASPTITGSSGLASVCWNATSAWHEVGNPPAGSTISWTITGGSILSGANDARVYYAPAPGSSNVGLDVTITNTAGCSIVRHYDVPVDRATPTISAGGPTTFCTGGSVTLSMPTAPAGWFYIWSNGATTQSITVSSSGTYTARYYRTQGGCTGPASEPVTVTVNPLPSATITPSGPTTFCEGGSVTLTAPAAASYLWSNGATTQSTVVNAAGDYSVTVTNANGCSTTSAATTVTVNAKPTPTITANGPTTFCDGNSVTLTASAGSSYLWSNGATTSSIIVTSAGNYSVTVTNANGCSATSAPTQVDVIPAVAASISASGPTTFCEGSSVTLTAPAAASYAWSNGATTQSIVVTASGSFSVTVTSANGCSSTSAATNVTVNPMPTPSISASGPTTFCTPGSVTLTGQGGSGKWYRDGVLFSTASAITINTVGSWTFTYRIVSAAGCSADSQPVTVTANATSTINQTGGSGSACWNETAWQEVVNPPAGATFAWTITNGSIVSGANAARVYYTAGPSATSVGLDVTLTNSAGCPTLRHFDIPVDRPAPTISASGPTTFCQGGSVTLTAAAAPDGWTYVWSNGTFNQSLTVSAGGTYSVSYRKTAGGCVSPASSPVTVTMNANPTATITPSGPTTFCAGGSVTLTASSGASYLWSNGATTQSIHVTSSGNYSVTVTNASGCSTLSAPAAVTVNSAATPAISGPSSFCQGSSATLTASAGASYLWSNGATTPSINVTAGGNYTVTVTQVNGCSATSAAKSVTMNAAPSTPTITPSGATTFCAGGNVTLSAPAGFSSYLWSNGATTQSINVTATGNYTVTVTNASGCSATSAPRSVTVNAVTGISAQPQNQSVPKNTAVTLSVTASGTGPFTYQWYRGTSPSTAQPVSGATSSTYVTPKLARGTYTYWVRVTGTCGVANSNTATITAN